MPYVSSRKAAEQIDCHPNTLRLWADAGKVEYVKTPSGQRKYDLETLSKPKAAQKRYCYCRVSSSSQKDDLKRQVAFMQEHYPEHEIVTDVASGMNCNRKGLRKLISQSLAGNVSEICIAHKDRLSRFSFDLIKWLLESHNVKLVVSQNESLSPQQEMTEDLMSIVHVFSCRMHGQRKYNKPDRARPDPDFIPDA